MNTLVNWSILVEFSKLQEEAKIKEGDIVLIGDSNIKRLNWPSAKVVKLFPGKDNKVRVVVLPPHASTLPRVTFNQPQIRAEEGSAVQLPCVAQGNPPPAYRQIPHALMRSSLPPQICLEVSALHKTPINHVAVKKKSNKIITILPAPQTALFKSLTDSPRESVDSEFATRHHSADP
ncbi:hypothetical protein CDAR_550181 [Caerostris darwini]|uniref:DUF5641 domain-containing protein n=1 Tax=Caerostris darwini TaxID=1538125 RepID=A0AAV4PHV2_9ARAC|nr:hypothetical protein CDAR_550181 [Caerostris darwini]